MSFWTADADARACALWMEGLSGWEVAQVIGAPSASAVVSRLWRLGLRRRPRSGSVARRKWTGITAVSTAPPPVVHPPCRPRPWITRQDGECAFPVDGEGVSLLSCCNPTAARSVYCPGHRAVALLPIVPLAAGRDSGANVRG